MEIDLNLNISIINMERKANLQNYHLKKVQPIQGRKSIDNYLLSMRKFDKASILTKQKITKTALNKKDKKWMQSEIFNQQSILSLNYQGIFRKNMLMKTQKRHQQSQRLEQRSDVNKSLTKKKLELSNRNKSLNYWKKQQENPFLKSLKSFFISLMESDSGCTCGNPCPWATKFVAWTDCSQQLIESAYEALLIKANSIKCNSPKQSEKQKVAQTQMHWKQIKKDIKRTQPYSKTFQNQGYLIVMQRILKCYCIQDPQIGYIQGMNTILSGLLYHIKNQSKTYYVFRKLMQQIRQIYLDNFIQIYAIIDQIKYQIKSIINDLYLHLEQLQVDITAMLFPWLASVMCSIVPLNSLYIIYDGLIQQKWLFIIKLCLSLLIYHKEDVKQLQDSGDILEWFSTNNNKWNEKINWEDIRKYSRKLKIKCQRI